MRISTSMQFLNNLKYLQRANTAVDHSSQQYNTGLKFERGGEDPSGMSSKIKYESSIASYSQFSKNAGLAADTLAEEETALGSLWDALSSINTRLIQAVDGTNDNTSLDALAEDIEQTTALVFDLMNSQNTEGEYIFSGSQSKIPTMSLTSEGHYICQADGASRSVQVAPSVVVQTSDSGLNIFQNCELAPTFSHTATPAVNYGMVENYGDFGSIYDKYHTTAITALNTYPADVNKVQFTVNNGQFNVTAFNPTTGVWDDLGSGEVDKTGLIQFKGMEFDVGSVGYTGTIELKLDDVKKDNILNQMVDIVNVLRDPTLTSQQKADKLAQAQISVENAMNQYDMYRGRVGAREQNIETVINSDNALKDIKKESKANITEIDAFEAASNIMQDQQALQVARQIYSSVAGSSLFDYI